MKKLLLMLALMLSMAAGACPPAGGLPAGGQGGGDADALYKEGKALYEAKDYTAALAKLRPAARDGHKKAQYRLGRCYDKGHGVEENNEEAFRWYSKSAAQGYYKAEYQLARAYLKGKGVKADEKKARQWLKKAVGGKKHGQETLDDIKAKAAAGDTTAQRLLELLK